jgi:glutamine synthetase
MKKSQIMEILKVDNVKFVKLMFVDLRGCLQST